jgi:hypothetical protein
MMASLGLPHWLMIAGALLVVAGFVGVQVSGKKPEEIEPPPDEPTDTPRQQNAAFAKPSRFQAKEQRPVRPTHDGLASKQRHQPNHTRREQDNPG